MREINIELRASSESLGESISELENLANLYPEAVNDELELAIFQLCEYSRILALNAVAVSIKITQANKIRLLIDPNETVRAVINLSPEVNSEVVYSVMPHGMDPKSTKLELFEIIEDHMTKVASHKRRSTEASVA